jgi:tetratricopeptide (TPR) repeat protein
MKIFVSSTVKEDLGDLRDELYRHLKDLGHTPWFSEQGDLPTDRHDDAMTNCIMLTEECDLFVLLLDKRAGLPYSEREGSPYPELFGLTNSEAEYRNARKKGKPVCIFIRKRTECESAIYRKLFKEKIVEKEKLENAKIWYAEPAVYEFYDRLTHEEPHIPWRHTFDSIEEIMEPLNTIIEKIENRLKDILENSGVLFIGEKVSEISGVPNFRDFIIEIIEVITKCKFGETDLIVLSKNLRSESAFKILHDEIGNDILICFEEFINYEPKPIHYYIANEIKKGKWVFTTNRDNLIEKACEPSDINIENKTIFEDDKFGEFYKNIQRHQLPVGRIFKLNGGFDKNKKGNWRFKPFLDSLKGVGKDLNENKMGVLKYFLENFDFCFLGYNCLDEFSTYQVLKNTPTEKEMFWFNHAEKLIEIISTPKHLEDEIRNEKSKRLIDRNRESLCINTILLKRKKFLKITGNWIEIIQNNLCSALDITQYTDLPPVKKKEHSIELRNLGERTDDYKKSIIHGRLWEECLSKEKAIKYFENAEKLGEGINKAKAKLSLARVYDKQYGKSEETNVINIYHASYEIYESHGISYFSEAAQCKIGLANFRRRALRQFDDALDECKQAKEMLELVKKRDKKYKLAYAQCLNCLGLIYSSKKESKYIDQCIDLFAESLKYKKEIGDIKGAAETENAIGLTKRNKENKDIKEINNAINHLEKSLEINESIGNYIGAARNYRNLGLCYTDLINLVENKNTKKKNFQLAKESYKSSMDYWYIMKDPPIEEYLEYKYRWGELEVNYGDINEGTTLLQEVEEKWDKIGNLHNRARSLDLLCKAYNSIEYIGSKGTKDVESTIDEIIRIYENVLGDKNKLKQMKEDKDIFNNVVQILKRTEETIIGLKEYCHKADNLDKIENLRKIMGETVSKSNK